MLAWGTIWKRIMFRAGRHTYMSKTTQFSSSCVHGEEELKVQQDANSGDNLDRIKGWKRDAYL